jgi:putative DNA primase/helicase
VHNNDELRGVLNSGHARDNAFTVRTVGDDHEPRRFSTWAATAIALISELHATLASRSIHIEMRRVGLGETVEPLRLDKASHLPPLARKAALWAADNLDALRGADPAMPQGFSNRRADNWRPLLAIADRAAGHWPQRARKAALKLDRPDAGQTAALMLLPTSARHG